MKKIYLVLGLTLIFSACTSTSEAPIKDVVKEEKTDQPKLFSDSMASFLKETIDANKGQLDSLSEVHKSVIESVIKGKEDLPSMEELEKIKKDLLQD